MPVRGWCPTSEALSGNLTPGIAPDSGTATASSKCGSSGSTARAAMSDFARPLTRGRPAPRASSKRRWRAPSATDNARGVRRPLPPRSRPTTPPDSRCSAITSARGRASASASPEAPNDRRAFSIAGRVALLRPPARHTTTTRARFSDLRTVDRAARSPKSRSRSRLAYLGFRARGVPSAPAASVVYRMFPRVLTDGTQR